MSRARGLGFAFSGRVVDDEQSSRNFREIEDHVALVTRVLLPVGGIIAYARDPADGDPIPDIFVRCNGQSLLRESYPALFAIIRTTFGAADSTHFNVPNIANLATDVKYFIRAS